MSDLRPIAVVSAETPAARAVAGGVATLLTAVGRWVEHVDPGDALDGHAAVVVARGRDVDAVRARFAGPVLCVDADLLDAAPALAASFAGRPVDAIRIDGVPVVLPRALPTLAGPALADGTAGLAVARAGIGYALPLVVTPTLRTVAGFWALAGAYEAMVAALVGEDTVAYVDPWPRGFRAARALTYDLDGLERGALPDCARDGRPATLFCCADALARLGDVGRGHELAAHGDVHRPFVDPRSNVARLERMLAAFAAAGVAPRGFSPPNLAWTSPLAALLERFAWVRIGYQERTFGFYPRTVAGAQVHGVSYYPDFLQRYVGADEYARLLGRFCAWAAATGVLAVPCFHPCLWDAPLRRFLDVPPGAVWEATLSEVTDWWAHRRRALVALAAGGEAPPDVVVVRTTPAERVAALRPVNGEPRPGPRTRGAARVVVDGRPVRVVPAADGPAVSVDVPLGAAWRPVGWLPASLRRALVPVTNKNGMNASLYGDLGLAPDVVGGALRLPVVAADEPVMVRPLVARDLGRVARGLVRRLVGAGDGADA
jgi:hypothetical protein